MALVNRKLTPTSLGNEYQVRQERLDDVHEDQAAVTQVQGAHIPVCDCERKDVGIKYLQVMPLEEDDPCMRPQVLL